MKARSVKLSALLVPLVVFTGIVLSQRWRGWSEGDSPVPEVLGGGQVSNRTSCVVFRMRPPQTMTKAALEASLRKELSPNELTQAVDPVLATPEMEGWARRLTAGTTNDTQRAKLLYDALASRVSFKPVEVPVNRTAQEVFAAWNTPGSSFLCLELAYLYASMASAVNLKPYVALVQVDCYGRKNPHACSGVFIDNRVLLVDPIYFWFGVPHKKFRLLNPTETVAAYLSERDNLEARRAATKLAPRLLMTRTALFIELFREQRWREAEEEGKLMTRLAPDAPETLHARAALALKAGRLELAEQFLRKAIEAAPQTFQYHALLGSVYVRMEKWSQAREAFEEALQYAQTQLSATDSRQALAYIETRTGVPGAMTFYEHARLEHNRGDLEAALTNYDQAISLKPDFWEAYVNRGLLECTRSNWSGAFTNLDRAIELRPDGAEAYLGRALVEQVTGALDGASADYSKAAQLNPLLNSNLAPRICDLGCLYYDQQQFSQALNNFRRASDLGFQNDYVQFRVWLAEARVAGVDSATRDLQRYLDSRDSTNHVDWASNIGNFLVGRLSEADFLKAAQSTDSRQASERLCEAYFYAGTFRLLKGDRQAAAHWFEESIATGVTTFKAYASAHAELKRLQEPDKRERPAAPAKTLNSKQKEGSHLNGR